MKKIITLMVVLLTSLQYSVVAQGEWASSILKASATDRGLCLVIGDSTGDMTASMAKGSRLCVQGCTWDAKTVKASRELLVAQGVADRASIACIEANSLPYADNLVNVLVSPSWGIQAINIQEVLRVLTPGGTAILGNDDRPDAMVMMAGKIKEAGVTDIKSLSRPGWIQLIKPADPRFDGWSHQLASADLSSVNNDKAVAPWEEIRWIGDPRWGSLYVSYLGRVTDGGRLYYKENRMAEGGRITWLVGRDAYNGVELWRVPSGAVWQKNSMKLDGTLTCDANNVYEVEGKSIVARDGRTGKKIRDFTTDFVPQMVTSIGNSLLASSSKQIAALDKSSGKVLWTRTGVAHPPSEANMAFVLGATTLEAVDITTGASRWKSPAASGLGDPLVCCKAGVVYVYFRPQFKGQKLLTAFDSKTGTQLWKMDDPKASYGMFPYANELVLLNRVNDEKTNNLHVCVLDPRTGTVQKEFRARGKVGSQCYPPKGTGNYLVYSTSWYLNRQSSDTLNLDTVRSPCSLGQCPANGLTYFLPHHCDCNVRLRGLLAMAAPGNKKWLDASNEGTPRLFASSAAPSPLPEKPEDWPMYRKDTRRSNFTTTKLPNQLKLLWSEKLGSSRLTQATAAYGMVFTSEAKSHQVFARDAASGKTLWSFVADGRIDFAPTLHKGLCLFGTGAGSVYALDAKTGNEVWRMRAAPTEKYIAEEGQFASSWPVIGGIMPMNGELYFSCGRAAGVEGGIKMFAVDAATGKIRWRVKGGTSGDFFLSDGSDLYMTKVFYQTATGSRTSGKKSASGLLRTTEYFSPVSIADYMACVEPALTTKKHVDLTDGRIAGENLAFNDNLGIASWRYRFGVPADIMKKDKGDQRFIYAKAGGKVIWLQDEIKPQIMGVVLAGETAYMTGAPAATDSPEKSELWVLAGADGKKLQTLTLPGRPAYDGLSASNGRLYVSGEDGILSCFGAN